MKKANKVVVSPRIERNTEGFYADFFESRTAGCQFVLEGFPGLLGSILDSLRGRFTPEEIRLIIHMHNGHFKIPSLCGRSFGARVHDAITMDEMDKQYGVDGDALIKKALGLLPFEAFALEVWACAFWYGGWSGGLTTESLDRWAARVLPEEEGCYAVAEVS